MKTPVDFSIGDVAAVCLPNDYNGFGQIEKLLEKPAIIGTYSNVTTIRMCPRI